MRNVWNKGKPWSEEMKQKLSASHTGITMARHKKPKATGSNNYSWKGEDVGYRGIHKWIQKNYGTPTTCEHCQTANLTGRQIHWATKTKEYKRQRENWLRLCAKCHGLYDRQNSLRKHRLILKEQ